MLRVPSAPHSSNPNNEYAAADANVLGLLNLDTPQRIATTTPPIVNGTGNILLPTKVLLRVWVVVLLVVFVVLLVLSVLLVVLLLHANPSDW